ncbi:MAG: outer membrane lipoprotein-sorting protein [Akkermansiaceae bacterium]|nr:outer membrane lipoprotein-sorting protein [Akkermansiaceae bacterium]
MKCPSPYVVLIALCMSMSSPVHADAAAEAILKSVRHGATLQENKLSGYLRKEGKRTPLSLTMNGEAISFQFFSNNKWRGFQMQLRQGNAKLFSLSQGKAKPFPTEKIGQRILDSDVTYEDLSLRFLYWKDATIMGQEKIKMQQCHKIRLVNPTNDGRYSIVYVWVHQKFGALMQVTGYNRDGKLLKRFHITDIMEVNKVQTIKKMNIETYKPDSNKVIGITYLEFTKPKKLGL